MKGCLRFFASIAEVSLLNPLMHQDLPSLDYGRFLRLDRKRFVGVGKIAHRIGLVAISLEITGMAMAEANEDFLERMVQDESDARFTRSNDSEPQAISDLSNQRGMVGRGGCSVLQNSEVCTITFESPSAGQLSGNLSIETKPIDWRIAPDNAAGKSRVSEAPTKSPSAAAEDVILALFNRHTTKLAKWKSGVQRYRMLGSGSVAQFVSAPTLLASSARSVCCKYSLFSPPIPRTKSNCVVIGCSRIY